MTRVNSKVLTAEELVHFVSIDDDCDWVREAVRHLQQHGVCVLSSNNSTSSVGSCCRDANAAATSRLKKLKDLIQCTRGIDPDGAGSFRFREVVSRDENGGRRYDMPVAWKGSNQGWESYPLCAFESQAICQFHGSLERMVQPVINALWMNNDNKKSATTAKSHHVAASGFLINQPGSQDQNWHRDGPHEGLINVFTPLVDLSLDLGPTEVWTNTHLSQAEKEVDSTKKKKKVIPLLKKGQVLMMDYRTYHRGLANTSPLGHTRTVAYAVYHRGASSSLGDKLSYGLLPRAYPPIVDDEKEIDASSDGTKKGEEIPFRVEVPPKANRNNDNSREWIQDAARYIKQYGVCVLDVTEIIDSELLQDVNQAATDRLSGLYRRISNRGIDPSGREEPYRFLEVVCRADRRFDMPVSWKNKKNIGAPWQSNAALESIVNFHAVLEGILGPLLSRLWDNDGNDDDATSRSYHVSATGFCVNKPGGLQQDWHRGCCSSGNGDEGEEITIKVFCPLAVDLTCRNIGPFEIWPKSHKSSPGDDVSVKVLPMLKNGQFLLMDGRTLYQHLENTSDKTWTLFYSDWKRGMQPIGEKSNLPDALTLEYD